MNLLSFLHKEKDKGQYFLALIFKPYSVIGVVFEEIAGKLSIVSNSEEKTHFNLAHTEVEKILELCDTVISSVEKSLPNEVIVKKTIFGVPYHWVDETGIKKEFQPKFKKICKDLELEPLGFIVSMEAVVHFLKKKEGAPISGILVEVIRDHVTLCVVRGGKIVFLKHHTVEGTAPETVEKLLKENENKEVLPSKIILLQNAEAETSQRDFLSYPWTHKLSFLHIPKVVILENGWEEEAVISGVASQMGFGVADETRSNHSVSEEELSLEEQEPDIESKEEGSAAFEDFGFIKEKDVLGEEKAGEEISDEEIEDEERFEKASGLSTKQNTILIQAKHLLAKIRRTVLKTSSRIKPFIDGRNISFARKLPFAFSSSRKILALPVILILLFFVSSYFYYASFLQAEVVLFLDKKEIKDSYDVTLLADEPTSVKNGVLKVEKVTHIKDGNIKKASTGKKEIGENAKGEIVIYNKTEQKKTFPKGTIIIGANQLQFELEDEISVASTSAFSTTYSSAKGKVVAARYGGEYNLPSNTNFIFKDLSTSDYFGKNDSAFSGGTKEEIRVVSKEDLSTLESDLLKQLEADVLKELEKKVPAGSVIVPYILSSEFSKKTFDKKEGDEVKEVKLAASLEFEAAYYKLDEMKNFEKEIAEEEVPEKHMKDEKLSRIELKDIEIDKDGNMTGKLDIYSVYSPVIDKESILQHLVKKRKNEGEELLKNMNGITDYTIIMRNRFNILPDIFPFSSNNIKITTRLNG
jgi:hypothetical protein